MAAYPTRGVRHPGAKGWLFCDGEFGVRGQLDGWVVP